MEILILLLMVPALMLPAIEGRHMEKLEKELREQKQRIGELESRLEVSDTGEDFEQVYAKGLAGIMAYSLKQAGLEEDEI